MLLALPPPALLRVWLCNLGALGYWEGQESQGVFVHVCVREGWGVGGGVRRAEGLALK